MCSYSILHFDHDRPARVSSLLSLFMNIPFYVQVAWTRVTSKGFPPLRGPPDVCMCCIIGCPAVGVQAGGPSDSEESGSLRFQYREVRVLGKPLTPS